MRLYEFDLDLDDFDGPEGHDEEYEGPGLSPETLILCKQVAAKLKKDCQPFLAATNNFKLELFRGINDFKGLPLLSKHKCPRNRSPVDSSRVIHKITDDWFKKNTGIGFRSNAIFSTGRASIASDYGDLFMLFPIGNFDFCYSKKIKDWYQWCEDADYNDDIRHDRAAITQQILNDLEDGQYEFNTSIRGFQNAIMSEHEIMIRCNHYYLLKLSDDDRDDLRLAEIRKYI